MQHLLLRNQPVTVIPSLSQKGHPMAKITIGDNHSHQFDSKSRISKALGLVTPEDLAERLSGGQYFFVDDNLHDFRDGDYTGFVHTDPSIQHLVDTIGITPKTDALSRSNVVSDTEVSLSKRWSEHNIDVPGYNEGGKYTSELHFNWNPFVNTVNSAFMLYRLICLNGMRGMRSFMNTKIPLVNRWEEHLDIANKQIQRKVHTMATQRLSQMGTERATLSEVGLLANHAHKRIKSNNENNLSRLRNIMDIASPELHLQDVYRSEALVNTNLAKQLPAHLTTYDVYNMATELRSHTNDTGDSTTAALDKLANDIVFERKPTTSSIDTTNAPSLSSFSNPDEAFFGLVH